ncbi:hypothetical protein H4582DRAFT_2052142 [Lactarius indigo]|nr:hypothetical protein H4582DRAFT_2052142 [Lactarius indigo]
MNHPPQLGSRVQWWDAKGKLKHGSVRAINVLSDNSRIIVIKVEDGQPATVTLPSVRMTCEGAENDDVNACRMGHDYNGRGLGRGNLEKWRDYVQLDASAVNATILRSHLTLKYGEIRQLNMAATLGITDSPKNKIRVHEYEPSHDGSFQEALTIYVTAVRATQGATSKTRNNDWQGSPKSSRSRQSSPRQCIPMVPRRILDPRHDGPAPSAWELPGMDRVRVNLEHYDSHYGMIMIHETAAAAYER